MNYNYCKFKCSDKFLINNNENGEAHIPAKYLKVTKYLKNVYTLYEIIRSASYIFIRVSRL